MHKNIVAFCLAIAATAIPTTVVFAQTSTTSPQSLYSEFLSNAGKHCLAGRWTVNVLLDRNTAPATAGSDRIFSGTIDNKLDSPIFDGSMIVQVRKLAQANGSSYATADDVVDRFVAIRGINLVADSSKTFDFPWHVPHGLVSGLYKIEIFLIVGDKMSLAGLENKATPVASSIVFVNGDTSEVSYIDTKSVIVGDTSLSLSGTATSTSATNASVDILNTYAKSRQVIFEYRVYKSMVTSDNDLEYSGSKLIDLQAGKKQTVNFPITVGDNAIRNVVVQLKDAEKNSIVEFKLINPKALLSQVVFAGMSDYPLEKDKTTTIFGCALLSDPDMIVSLSLVDNNGATLLDLGSISGSMNLVSFSRNIIPSVGIATPFKLKVSLTDKDGGVRSTASISYLCDVGICSENQFINWRNATVVFTGLILGIIGLIFRNKKRCA